MAGQRDQLSVIIRVDQKVPMADGPSRYQQHEQCSTWVGCGQADQQWNEGPAHNKDASAHVQRGSIRTKHVQSLR